MFFIKIKNTFLNLRINVFNIYGLYLILAG